MQATLERLAQRRENREDEGGFTLIELLIVIVILGILAAIVVFAVQNLSSTSAQASCKSDWKTVETAAEAYKAQTEQYPGGTFATGDGLVQTAGTTYSAGINDLLGTVKDTQTSTTGVTLGPWLKDAPVNADHYQIEYTYNAGAGEEGVFTAPTSGTAAQVGTYTEGIAACSAVS
jgi:prepilin-type N-terminal cleavage/methylation domain-containing protein